MSKIDCTSWKMASESNCDMVNPLLVYPQEKQCSPVWVLVEDFIGPV